MALDIFDIADFSRSKTFEADGRTGFLFNNTNRGAGNRKTTVVPENRDNFTEVLRREEAAATSQQVQLLKF